MAALRFAELGCRIRLHSTTEFKLGRMSDQIAIAIGTELDLLRAVRDMPCEDTPRDRLAHDSAKYALDLGPSCSLLIGEEHTVAFQILLRSLSESVIRLGWGLQSDENAASLEVSAHNDFRKNLASLVKGGVLSFRNPSDGLSLDDTILELAVIDKEHKPTNIRDMAKALGLEHFYQILYKNLSMQTHGNANIVVPSPSKSTFTERAHALLGGLQTVKILSAKWLALREIVGPGHLQSMLLPAGGPNKSFGADGSAAAQLKR